MPTDRVVVLRRHDSLAFVADACAVAAEAVNEPRSWGSTDEALAHVYAELVVAYARLLRPELAGTPAAVVDHLMGRVAQARAGEITTPLLDVVDRLHAELTTEPALA